VACPERAATSFPLSFSAPIFGPELLLSIAAQPDASKHIFIKLEGFPTTSAR
jgi:hypothetical protein